MIGKFHRVLSALLTIATLFSLVSCVPQTQEEERVEISSVNLNITEYFFTDSHDYLQLDTVIKPANAENPEIIWQSSDTNIATVDAMGTVRPVSDGQALITARSPEGYAVAGCEVTVGLIFPVGGIAMNTSQLSFDNLEDKAQLSYKILPENATNKNVTWSTSNPEVALVSENGVITLVNDGQTTITVTTEDGGFTAGCNVSVNTVVPMEDVNFDISSFTFKNESDVLVLTPVWEPADTTERGLTWSSSNSAVATVDPNTGVVTPLKNGTTTIKALSDNGLKNALCRVTVDLPVPVTGITIDDDQQITLTKKAQEYKLVAHVMPSNATEQEIIYESSDASVVEVSKDGVIKVVADGNATVTATSKDGGYRASVKVTVAIEPPKPEAITFEKYSCKLTKRGQTFTIQPIIYPEDAENKECTFESDDKSIATVDKNGVVTAVGDGIAFITVRSKVGDAIEIFYVNVDIKSNATSGETVEHTGDLVGAWVATVGNIDFPSRPGLSASQLKEEIDAIVADCKKMGVNAIFFQVRPEGDALYYSDIFPSSSHVVLKQGQELPIDCLAYFIKAAHAENIELHAWINPYRISQVGSFGTDLTKLAANHPARLHPEWVVKHTDGAMYFNPGIPEVRQLIVDGVMEIVANYDIDGIHFDDYFYPDDDRLKFPDGETYEKYKQEGQSLADWRRSNNDALILQVSSAIKSLRSDIDFGISPCGVWALKSNHPDGTNIKSSMEAYYQVYADTRKWVLNEWIDYICPQIYWEINHSTAPFKPIVDWWNDLVANVGVELYVGIAAYRGTAATAYKNPAEIKAQLDYLDTKPHVDGAVFFSYSNLKENTAGVKDTVSKKYGSGSTSTIEPIEPEIPVEGDSTDLVLAFSNYTVSNDTENHFILGVADPKYPIYVNGAQVTDVTEKGYFSYYIQGLQVGKNEFTVTQMNQTKVFTVTRAEVSTSANTMSEFGFINNSFSPLNDYANASGTTLTVSCTATAGAKVYAKIGDYTVQLSTYTKKATDGTLKRAYYSGSFVMPEIEGNAAIGGVTFYAEMDGYATVEKKLENLVEVINNPDAYAVQVNTNMCNLMGDLEDDPDEYYVATKGAIDGVVAKWGGNTKLKSGNFIANTNVEKLDDSLSLASVFLMMANQTADGKYTEINFITNYNMMHRVWMYDDKTEIVLYNVATFPEELTLAENPLFSNVYYTKNGTTVTVTLIHKKSSYIFGYTPEFRSGQLVFSFKNPISLSVGDKPLAGIKISIDPGHSTDGGAVGPWGSVKWTEAEWNYKLSLLVNEKLIALGAETYVTHHRELIYELDDIVVQFREWKPDLNISIHYNYVPDSANPANIKGVETYYSYASSKLLAKTVLEKFCEGTGLTYRNYKPGYYKVSRFMEFPSILFETAFISNIYEYEWFTYDANMEKAAKGIVDGIVEYYRLQS